MAFKSVALILLCAVLALAQHSQGGGHEDQGVPHHQGRVRRQVSQDDGNAQPLGANWTSCDFITTPAISCYDCNTRLICKPVGGLLKFCGNPLRPYCNNGICTAVPSAACT